MAIDPGVFDHTVTSWAPTHFESNVISASLLGEPADSTILALFLLGEIPTLLTVLGGAAVLGGIYVSVSQPTLADMGGSGPGHSSEDVSVHLPLRIRYQS